MLTITEALAEVKTIAARIDKKRESIMLYFARDGRAKDPLEAEGGSFEFVRRERQGIADLTDRLIRIRAAIQQVNHATVLTIEGATRSVADWLTWRREVAPGMQGFLNRMTGAIAQVRQQAQQQGRQLTDSGPGAPNEFVVAVSERALVEEVERMTNTLGVLDGKLSLLNATTVINVD